MGPIIYMTLLSAMSSINYGAFFSFIQQTFLWTHHAGSMDPALCCLLGNLRGCKLPEGWVGANCACLFVQPTLFSPEQTHAPFLTLTPRTIRQVLGVLSPAYCSNLLLLPNFTAKKPSPSHHQSFAWTTVLASCIGLHCLCNLSSVQKLR